MLSDSHTLKAAGSDMHLLQRAGSNGVSFNVITFAILVLASPFAAEAGTIEKVKGAQAIVSFGDDEGEIAVGSKLFATEGGKRKALLEVLQFKNGRARVKVTKGQAKAGMEVLNSNASGKESNSATSGEAGSKKERSPRNAGAATIFKNMTLGFLGGYGLDSQNVKVPNSSQQEMSGSGFSVRGFADIPVSGSLALLSRVGVEQFNVQLNSVKTEILYAVIDLMLKYSFAPTGFVPFVMGGLGLHFPISKKSDLLDVNRISSTTVFYGGAGFNYVLGGSTYLQLTAEYGMFPPSNDVTTNLIAIRGGLGFRF
jgi:hypothetical protein